MPNLSLSFSDSPISLDISEKINNSISSIHSIALNISSKFSDQCKSIVVSTTSIKSLLNSSPSFASFYHSLRVSIAQLAQLILSAVHDKHSGITLVQQKSRDPIRIIANKLDSNGKPVNITKSISSIKDGKLVTEQHEFKDTKNIYIEDIIGKEWTAINLVKAITGIKFATDNN